MADYYLQFSFELSLNSDEAKAWAREAVRTLEDARDEEILECDESDDDFKAFVASHPLATDILPEADYVGFTAEVDRDGLWIYANESGEPDSVVSLLQDYLRKFDPAGFVGFEWANTCSRPRLDSFGGGGAFVTVDAVEFMNSGNWLADKMHAFKESA